MLPSAFYGTDSTIRDNPSSEGGYWKELNLTVTYDKWGAPDNTPLFNSYTFWEGDTRDGIYSVLKNSINNNWGTTLSIGQYGTGHAITMWGYDMDADGNLIIYLTDSDDYALGMFRQKVIVDDEKHIYLTSVDGENNVYGYNYDEAALTGTRLGELQSFTAPLGDLRIPEPGTGILSLCGVFLTVSRRRRILR